MLVSMSTFPKQKLEKNLYSLEAILNFLADLVGKPLAAPIVVQTVKAALEMFKARIDGDNPLAASEMIDRLQARIDKLKADLATNDAATDDALAAKFDTSGSDA